MKNKITITLIIIFLLSVFIRIYRANYTPPLLWDEAALGYNAYSILQTGKDEYGHWFPLIFKSFGDYKPGLYVYLSIPFVWLFGLNEISIKLPSIILGSLTPILLYFFIKTQTKSKNLALISTILLAFNPFNIHFSRSAWESNVLVFELLLASFLFFKNKYLFSSLVFASTFYTYQSAKLLTPLIIFSLILVTFKKIPHTILYTFFIPLFLLSLPLIYNILFQSGGNRLKVVSLLSYPRSDNEKQTIISESGQLDFNIFHNQFVFFSRNFLSRYFNHFSPRFLIFDGDWQSPRHSAPYIGVILFPSLIFFIIGLFSSFHSKIYDLRSTIFFFFWLLLAPVPAALTRDSLSAVRSLPLSIPLIYFTALGLNVFLKRFHFSTISYLLFTICYLLSFTYYSDLYYNHMVKLHPKEWLYGYKEAVTYLLKEQNNYQQIYLSDFYGQPYIYYLFYSHYNPVKYQQQAKLTTESVDTGKVERIDNILFKEPYFANLPPKTLAIFSHDEVLRQNIDTKLLTPLSQVGDYSTFYAYETQ